jgi:hypothetical protein
MTASCSSVPAVRSRTRPRLVTMVPMKAMVSPINAAHQRLLERRTIGNH